MKLSFVAVCEERYILIWNCLHCQYLNYQTTKCYLMLWKISSEIGPFFKDNLLPVNIRARECHCQFQCLSFKLFHCALTLLPSAVVPVIVSVLPSSDGVCQTSSIKVYSLWSSSKYSFSFTFSLHFWQQLSIARMRSSGKGWKFHLISLW